MNDEDILKTNTNDLVEERDLFRKYELSFNNMTVNEMILVKRTWKKKFPGKDFYRCYGRYVMDYQAARRVAVTGDVDR